jgi:hypothetical protein
MGVMALPAHIPLAMRGHINAWYFFGAVGVLGVTPSAEFPRLRLAGPEFPGPDFVLLGGLMAARARNVHMMGKGFGPRNVGMASVALFGRFGGLGVMRIVARDARLEGVVRGRDGLREPRGPGRKELMTQRAVTPLAWRWKLDRGGILRMSGGRPVADLAGDAFVISLTFGFHDIRMAIGARHLAGILDWLCDNVVDRRSAIVTMNSEIARDQIMPRHEQGGQQDDQQNHQSLDLLGDPVPESWLRCYRRGTIVVLIRVFIHNL